MVCGPLYQLYDRCFWNAWEISSCYKLISSEFITGIGKYIFREQEQCIIDCYWRSISKPQTLKIHSRPPPTRYWTMKYKMEQAQPSNHNINHSETQHWRPVTEDSATLGKPCWHFKRIFHFLALTFGNTWISAFFQTPTTHWSSNKSHIYSCNTNLFWL